MSITRNTDWEQIHFKDATIVDWHVHPSLKVFLFKRMLTSPKGASRAFNPLSFRSDFEKLRSGGLDVLLSTVYSPEREIIQDCRYLQLLRYLMPGTYRKIYERDYFEVTSDMLDQMEEQVKLGVKDGKPQAKMAKSVQELDEILSPLADRDSWEDQSLIDCNVRAERMGWLPSAPQLEENPLVLSAKAREAGVSSADYVAGRLKDGSLRMSCQAPDDPRNFPRNLFIWRSNLLGSSGKGHEYMLKHLLGTKHGVLGKHLGETGGQIPSEVEWVEQDTEGKIDLVVTLETKLKNRAIRFWRPRR